jgi:hypothetical protein
MKKIILSVIALSFISANVFAANYGIGIDLSSDGTEVRVPIDISQKYRIEPYFSYIHKDGSSSFETYSWRTIGANFLMSEELVENTKFFYGIKTEYGEMQDKSNFWSAGPTINFEYFFSPKFSVGGEASLLYTKFNYQGNSIFSNDERNTQTSSSVLVRYYFN